MPYSDLIPVYLKQEAEEALARRHPWIYAVHVDVARTPELPREGWVRVYDARGKPVGTGILTPGILRIRILSWNPQEEVEPSFWVRRFRRAWELRKQWGLPAASTTGFRLIHAEGDGIPGLVVDIYEHYAVFYFYLEPLWKIREELVHALREVLPELKGCVCKPHEGLGHEPDLFAFSSGSIPEFLPFQEDGVRFLSWWRQGHKTGFYLDQRPARVYLSRFLEGVSDAPVLEMFAYTGAFSVHLLAKKKCPHAILVETSEAFLDLVQEHLRLNGIPSGSVELICEDVFDFLNTVRIGKELVPAGIICDPPAFAKHPVHRLRALRGYTFLNQSAFTLLERYTRSRHHAGWLATFSCSEVIRTEDFRRMLFLSARSSFSRDVHARVVAFFRQGPDHPEEIFHPEGFYLKGYLVQVSL